MNNKRTFRIVQHVPRACPVTLVGVGKDQVRNALYAFLFILAHYSVQAVAEEKKGNAIVEIERIIIELHKDRPATVRSVTERWGIAKRLSDYVGSLNRSEIDSIPSRIIDDITALLGDSDQGVRSHAADALGYIGPLANRAVPALERALGEIEPPPNTGVIGPSISSGPAIRRALQRITGEDMTPDPYRERPGSWESRNR